MCKLGAKLKEQVILRSLLNNRAINEKGNSSNQKLRNAKLSTCWKRLSRNDSVYRSGSNVQR